MAASALDRQGSGVRQLIACSVNTPCISCVNKEREEEDIFLKICPGTRVEKDGRFQPLNMAVNFQSSPSFRSYGRVWNIDFAHFQENVPNRTSVDTACKMGSCMRTAASTYS